MGHMYNSNISGLNQGGDFLERPRLHNLLKKAMDYPLVVICAGAGYGKTRAVYSFLQEYQAHMTWLQISERDNIGARFWESYTGMMANFWPQAGARLLEIGFPETDDAFTKYSSAMKEVVALPGKHIRVFDDFHLLYDPAVLRFFEWGVSMCPPNVTLILISRAMPDINLIGLMMRGSVFMIHEDTLCFTEDEISEYFSRLQFPGARVDIRDIYDDTQGWAFAINLIGRSLAKEQKYERYALEAMKKNIFRLIEAEIAQTVSPPLWRFLLRMSLVDHLAASLIDLLANDEALIKEMEALNAYIRYDFNLDTYMIHHLLLDYLRQKQEQILTDEERREIYQTAGQWCDANGYHMDALAYYEKSADHAAIMRNIASFNVQVPADLARYALEIFDRAPTEVKSQNPIYPAMYLKLKISLGQLDEVSALAMRYVAEYRARPESPQKNRALTAIYAIWALARMKICTYTDVYDFDIYFEKMGEYYDKSPFTILGAYTLISANAWASHVGTNRAAAQEEYLRTVSRAIPQVARVLNGGLAGFDDLVRGELCFYRQEFAEAEQYLQQAHDKARTRDQYVTQNRALVYLMQIAFFRGDSGLAHSLLQSMETLLSEKDYGTRYTMYDIACGFFHLALAQPQQMPEWLKGDFSPYTHSAFLENYGNRVKALYHYQTRQYSSLLAFIGNVQEQRMILFGKIELKILAALSLYQLKRRNEAIDALTSAYYFAAPNHIIAPFTQHAKDMRTLSAAALRDNTCVIPQEWLEDINRKSSAFAKRKAQMLANFPAAHDQEIKIALTEREISVLKDLYQGLSRTEIAVSQDISVNTVKTVINIIYDKLSVNTLPDAIRVAVEQGIRI